MKKFLLIIFLSSIGICYAQFIPHKASITPSKDAVLSSETFKVTYTLTEVEGNVYIGIEDLYFEIIGDDRWEGYVKIGDTVSVTFTVKFKEKFKPYLTSEKAVLSIGFSYHPWDKRIGEKGEFESIPITLKDYSDFKQEGQHIIIKDSSFQVDDSSQELNLYLLHNETPGLRREVIPDTNSIKLE